MKTPFQARIERDPAIGKQANRRRLALIGKRVLDVAGSGVALLVLSLPMMVVGLAIWLSMGTPVLFRQQRPGLGGRPFTLYKFRTMKDATDPAGRPLPDKERLTPFGKWLRATSVDELPELWNVLKGDMSLVGPRPLLMDYLQRYTPEQGRRHEVKPGITGWAQIRGRNLLTWQEKFKYDAWYVDHWSLGLDLRILLVTVWKVLRRDGISAHGHVTMPEFTGSDQPVRRED